MNVIYLVCSTTTLIVPSLKKKSTIITQHCINYVYYLFIVMLIYLTTQIYLHIIHYCLRYEIKLNAISLFLCLTLLKKLRARIQLTRQCIPTQLALLPPSGRQETQQSADMHRSAVDTSVSLPVGPRKYRESSQCVYICQESDQSRW